MDSPTDFRPSNSTIAGYILSLIASTPKDFQLTKLTELLDRSYPSRNARAAAKGNKAMARTGDKKTSHEAAMLVKVPEAEQNVLRAMASRMRALTVYDLVEITGISYQSVSPRLGPLETKGLIEVVGIDRSSGHGRSLYALTAAGKARSGGSIDTDACRRECSEAMAHLARV